MRVYRAENANSLQDTETNRQIATENPYPPTAFLLYGSACAAALGDGSHFMDRAERRKLSFCIVFDLEPWGRNTRPRSPAPCFASLLANSELLIVCGNVAGLVISLCVIAVWCFFRERFVWLGIVCLAISLALKPHDTGMVWLYFLLAGGIYRKRALQTLLATAVIGLPALLWIWVAAPHWLQEMRFNLQTFSAHGGINDPGLASSGGHGLDMLISLQTVFSVFWDNPRFYNLASYLVCAPLLLVWACVTLRSRRSPRSFWLGLATIAALSMLPVYHRQLDAKLLMLTVPACAMLWSEAGVTARLALLVNGVGLLLIGDLPWAILLALMSNLHSVRRGIVPAGQYCRADVSNPADSSGDECLLSMGLTHETVRPGSANREE